MKSIKGKLVITMLCISCLMLSLSIVYAFQRQDVGSPVRIVYKAQKASGGEIWDATNKSFDRANLDILLQTITGDRSSSITNTTTLKLLATAKTTAAQMRAFSVNKAAGADITVTLGGLQWTATYLSTDKNDAPILTLWLDGKNNKLTTSEWSEDGRFDNPDEQFPNNMYGVSYIRAVTLNNGGLYATMGTGYSSTAQKNSASAFALFTMDSGGLTKYLDTPKQVTWQEYGQNTISQFGDAFANSCPNENWSDEIPNIGTYKDETYNFYENSSKSVYLNYAKREYNSAWADDYLWLPSLTETGYDDSHIGLWELNTEQRKIVQSSSSGGGGTGVGGTGVGGTGVGVTGNAFARYSWLRSGFYNTAALAYILMSSGSNFLSTNTSATCAVRPALHLNLKEVITALGGSI